MRGAATFTVYGRTEDTNRVVRFYKRDGVFVCDVEGMPALTVVHPSYKRVRAAFLGWYGIAQKDWGASDIDWAGMDAADEIDWTEV